MSTYHYASKSIRYESSDESLAPLPKRKAPKKNSLRQSVKKEHRRSKSVPAEMIDQQQICSPTLVPRSKSKPLRTSRREQYWRSDIVGSKYIGQNSPGEDALGGPTVGIHRTNIKPASSSSQKPGPHTEDFPDINDRSQRNILPPPLDHKGNRRYNSQHPSGYSRISNRSFDYLPADENVRSDENVKGESAIGKALQECDWNMFCKELKRLSSDDIVTHINAPYDHVKSTAFHTVIWKAPPSLVGMLLDVLEVYESLDSCYMACDVDENTPLHLACANLDADSDVFGTSLANVTRLVEICPLSVKMQNAEGDTPLHLLVSSPACCSHDLSKGQLNAIVSAMSVLLDSASDIRKLIDSSGATILHTAIAHHAHEQVLLTLILHSPMTASIGDTQGMLPLHYVAALLQIPDTFVKELISVYPEAVTQGSVYSDTSLHILVSNAFNSVGDLKIDRNSRRVIQRIMGKDPHSNNANSKDCRANGNSDPLIIVNQDRLTPLHCCALFDTPPQLTRLMMKNPIARYATSLTNNFGATPLHLASAQLNVEHSIATVVALGTREAATTPDRLSRTPLHVAAQNSNATGQLVEILTDMFPAATGIKTQRGHLPLHLAAQTQSKEAVVKALIRAYPKATEARDISNNTPLHDAAKYRASAGVVQLLLETYPDAVYIQNQHGNLPLHCATAYQASNDVVHLLLEAWPDGASMQNRNQDAPLHYAAAYCTRSQAVQPLIDAAPAAVLLLNSSGRSPIDRARANCAPKEILDLLEASAEEWTKRASTNGWGSFGTEYDDEDDDGGF